MNKLKEKWCKNCEEFSAKESSLIVYLDYWQYLFCHSPTMWIKGQGFSTNLFLNSHILINYVFEIAIWTWRFPGRWNMWVSRRWENSSPYVTIYLWQGCHQDEYKKANSRRNFILRFPVLVILYCTRQVKLQVRMYWKNSMMEKVSS